MIKQPPTTILYRLLLALNLLILSVGCGNSALSFEDKQASENASFFSYPFKAAPSYYLSSALYIAGASADPSAPLSAVKYQGAATYIANPNEPVNYTVTVFSADGQTPLCPAVTGTLTGTSAISFTCTLSSTSTHVLVVLSVTSDIAGPAQIETKY